MIDCEIVLRAVRAQAPGQNETQRYAPLKNDYSHPMDALQYGCYFYKHGLVNGDGQSDEWGRDDTSPGDLQKVNMDCVFV